jgi:hypothetical protein
MCSLSHPHIDLPISSEPAEVSPVGEEAAPAPPATPELSSRNQQMDGRVRDGYNGAPTQAEVKKWRRIKNGHWKNIDYIYTWLFGNDSDGTVKLQISEELLISLLLVEDEETGRIRYYSREAHNEYFCTHCNKDLKEGQQPKVKARVEKGGRIRFGTKAHKPGCRGRSKRKIIREQLERRLALYKRGRRLQMKLFSCAS